MRAPVFLCSCTSIGTSPLQPVLFPPPPAGSFPLQPALLRRSWPSFDPLPVFCGLSVPSPCSFRALSVLPPCPFRALSLLSLALSLLSPCSLRVFSVLFPCPFLASSLLSPCPFHDLLPIPLKGGKPPPRASGVMHAPVSSIYRQSFFFFRSPVNAVFLGPLFRYRCAAKNRARLFPLGPDFLISACRLVFVSPSMLFYPYT